MQSRKKMICINQDSNGKIRHRSFPPVILFSSPVIPAPAVLLISFVHIFHIFMLVNFEHFIEQDTHTVLRFQVNMDILNHFHYFIIISEDLDLQYRAPEYDVYANYSYIRQENTKINTLPGHFIPSENDRNYETIIFFLQ
jgi:hypothetical protein